MKRLKETIEKIFYSEISMSLGVVLIMAVTLMMFGYYMFTLFAESVENVIFPIIIKFMPNNAKLATDISIAIPMLMIVLFSFIFSKLSCDKVSKDDEKNRERDNLLSNM